MSSASEVVGRLSGLSTRRLALARWRMADMHARSKMNARRRRKKVLNNAECSEALSQPQLSLDHWTPMGALGTEVEDEWYSVEDLRPSEWRPLDVPKESTLAEGKEEEDETEMETSGQRLRHSDELEAILNEDLRSSGKRTLDLCEEIEKSSEVPSSGKAPLEQFAPTVGKKVTEKPMLPLCLWRQWNSTETKYLRPVSRNWQ